MVLMTKVLWGTKDLWGTKVRPGTKVLRGTKVHMGTNVRGTEVLGTKVLFHWEGDESPGTKALGSKVGEMKVLQPIKKT